MRSLRLFRQPLFHFLIIGVAIFALFEVINDDPAPRAGKQIVVTTAMAEQLAARFQAAHRRPPSRRELTGLVDDFIKDEVLVREAVALSLDKNDAVIRRRLRKKMQFLTTSAAAALQPSDDQLRAYFDANAKRYASGAKVAFEQVFLGQAPTKAAIAKVREALQTAATPAGLGARTFLPSTVPLSPQTAIDKTFGRGFSKQLAGLKVDDWAGPLRSGYGLHSVRVRQRVQAEVPPFESVRKTVLADWKRARAAEISEQQYVRMRDRYIVSRPDISSVEVLAQ